MRHHIRISIIFLIAVHYSAFSQTPQTPGEIVAHIVKTANTFLSTLDAGQRDDVLYDFDDREQRENWSNLPVSMIERGGLRMGDLAERQKEAVFHMLQATLSEAGFQQIIDNINGDEVLAGQSSRGRRMFGKDEFYVSILGQPSISSPWMWQFGGHHLGVNATISGDQVTLSPSLTGGQPINYELNGVSYRQLAKEVNLVVALAQSFSDEQKKQAVLAGRYDDMRYGPDATTIVYKAEGINALQLNDKQQQLLLELIAARVGILNDIHAGIAMAKIRDNLKDTWFSWFGPTEPGYAFSFRIQAPTLVMEYCPQRLGGDPTNHIHAMYRDPSNDYGVKDSNSKYQR